LRPIHIHSHSQDESITVREVFDELVYKPSWFELEPKKTKKIVDVGALIGSFSLWAHEKFPNALIYAYEPDPDSFEYLLKNIKAAKAGKKIFAKNFAVWRTNSLLKLHRFENTFGSNSIVFKDRPFVGEYLESINVKSISIKKIISELGTIDFLKLDCEGAEYNILYSLEKNDFKKIRNLVLEYHEFDNDSKHKGLSLSNHLRKNGFITQIIPTDTHPGHGLGYIFASRMIKDKKLEVIFDEFTKQMVNLRGLADEREKYAKELENAVRNKTDELSTLRVLADEREKYAKELENTVKLKSDDLERFNKILKDEEQEINNYLEIIQNKETLLIEIRDQLSEIEKSVMFRIMKNLGKKIDSTFPNETKRGELKKIAAASLSIIAIQGFKNYLSEVNAKLKRREFRVLTPMSISEEDEISLKRKVVENKKNRLEITPHNKKEIKNDEIVITPEEKNL